MEANRDCMKIRILVLYISIAVISFTHCEARKSMQIFKGVSKQRSPTIKHLKKFDVLNQVDIDLPLDSTSNTNPYGVSSPFSLPPFDSLAPIPLPQNTAPFCDYPPFAPQPPSTAIPTPMGYTSPQPPPPPFYFPPIPMQSPPPSSSGTVPSPPEYSPSPNPPESPPSAIPSPSQSVPSPTIYVPSPPESSLSPPYYEPSPPESSLSPPYYEPSSPSYVPGPPSFVPSPGSAFVPSPPVFQPPVVYPPPTVPPPPHTGPSYTLWCVAKPSVPDPIVQEAMNYACGSGADCNSIQTDGSCYEPNTLFAHASYAFNDYWQRNKAAGGTCDFGGTAILVTVDPSYDGCHFMYN